MDIDVEDLEHYNNITVAPSILFNNVFEILKKHLDLREEKKERARSMGL